MLIIHIIDVDSVLRLLHHVVMVDVAVILGYCPLCLQGWNVYVDWRECYIYIVLQPIRSDPEDEGSMFLWNGGDIIYSNMVC